MQSFRIKCNCSQLCLLILLRTYRLILSACGCEDYEEKISTKKLSEMENGKENDDDNENDNEDENENGNGNENGNEETVLKITVMIKKLHSDPGSFSALIDSIKLFLKSLPNATERTILSLYVADR